MGTIADAWTSAVEALGGRSMDAGDVEAAYERPGYHSTAHVEAVLRDVDVLADEVGLTAADRACVVLAACAHDVVYEGRAGEDERASAQWAVEALRRAAVATDHASRVRDLVLATASHDAPDGDRAAAVLLDADLAILASAPEKYAAYVDAVRHEYAHVSEDDWRRGRAAVLRSLVERPRLFATDAAHDRWEAAARSNVAAELSMLGTDRPTSP